MSLGPTYCTHQARLVAGLHEGKAVDIYLDFSKGFNTVFHTILLGKSWHPTDWTDAQFTGLKTGWMVRSREQFLMVLHPVFSQSPAVSLPRAVLFRICLGEVTG